MLSSEKEAKSTNVINSKKTKSTCNLIVILHAMHLLVYQGSECTMAIYIRYTSFILERINCSEFENMRLLNERQRNQLMPEKRRKLHVLKENTYQLRVKKMTCKTFRFLFLQVRWICFPCIPKAKNMYIVYFIAKNVKRFTKKESKKTTRNTVFYKKNHI